MNAGRDVDALVAITFFGWPERHAKKGFRGSYGGGAYEQVPSYSVDIAAAWGILEKAHAYTINHFFGRQGVGVSVQFEPNRMGTAVAETAPLAICLAALDAKGVRLP